MSFRISKSFLIKLFVLVNEITTDRIIVVDIINLRADGLTNLYVYFLYLLVIIIV